MTVPEGFELLDLHNHTHRSYDAVNRLEDYAAAHAAGRFDVLAITDHNVVAGALELARDAPFPVIVGQELDTADGELIGLFLQEAVPPGLPRSRRRGESATGRARLPPASLLPADPPSAGPATIEALLTAGSSTSSRSRTAGPSRRARTSARCAGRGQWCAPGGRQRRARAARHRDLSRGRPSRAARGRDPSRTPSRRRRRRPQARLALDRRDEDSAPPPARRSSGRLRGEPAAEPPPLDGPYPERVDVWWWALVGIGAALLVALLLLAVLFLWLGRTEDARALAGLRPRLPRPLHAPRSRPPRLPRPQGCCSSSLAYLATPIDLIPGSALDDALLAALVLRTVLRGSGSPRRGALARPAELARRAPQAGRRAALPAARPKRRQTTRGLTGVKPLTRPFRPLGCDKPHRKRNCLHSRRKGRVSPRLGSDPDRPVPAERQAERPRRQSGRAGGSSRRGVHAVERAPAATMTRMNTRTAISMTSRMTAPVH